MENCPICRIVNGEIEVVRLYEGELVLVFLHRSPINEGHALVVPRKHWFSITAVPPECQTAMMAAACLVGKLMMRVVDGDGFNFHVATGDCAGQSLEHTHMHVIPRLPTDGFSWGWRSIEVSDERMSEIKESFDERLQTHES